MQKHFARRSRNKEWDGAHERQPLFDACWPEFVSLMMRFPLECRCFAKQYVETVETVETGVETVGICVETVGTLHFVED